MSEIRQLTDPRTGTPFMPVASERAVYGDDNKSLPVHLGEKINYTDALSLEEIAASTSLTGKVASADAIKLINSSLSTLYNQIGADSLNVSFNGLHLYTSAPGTAGNPTTDGNYITLSFTSTNTPNFGIQISIQYNSQNVYIRYRWSSWTAWIKLH